MKRIITLIMMLFLTSGILTAQDTKKDEGEVVINHKVELGETVLMICKKYVVLPNDFYKYNKEAIHGIRPNEVLRIPLHKSKKKNAIETFKNTGVAANVPAPSQQVSAKD
jgi:hypothetical protein